MKKTNVVESDVVLIGAGIMSATLGILLKELEPNLTITIVERLDRIAGESSDAWNNAGTGHSAFCELNYTPETTQGNIDISKAVQIASSFELSRGFWAYLANKGIIRRPGDFIHNVPHMSFVWGNENVTYLKKRHAALTANPLFKGMLFSESRDDLANWMPLVMGHREELAEHAATRMEIGTDVNFGTLSRILFDHLQSLPGVSIKLRHEVRDLEKDNGWQIRVKDLETNRRSWLHAPFVFIGAGGGALTLLEKSDIAEAEGYGGFPVSGQWLRCNNEKIIAQHAAKVYGKAAVGSPPMSVPHLDTRIINGKKALMFGPYAGFSTKFLKQGSYWDLAASLELDNLIPMLSAGIHNIPLTKYLIQQSRQSPDDRLEALREYFPDAVKEDWELEVAGQRVQVIKKDEKEGGILEFGTELVTAADGSIAALLGASPGASTSVAIMLDVLKTCFKDRFESKAWQDRLKKMIPSFGKSLSENESLCYETRKNSSLALGLKYFEAQP